MKELRKEKKLTQQEAAKLTGVSLRSYKTYENDPEKESTSKYEFMMNILSQANIFDEEHGLLQVKEIKDICSKVFQNHDISYCYLFGSYAKGKAKENSDVDLLISTSLKGLKYYGLVEELRLQLKKKVDVLDVNQLKDNISLIQEILKDGIKIYG